MQNVAENCDSDEEGLTFKFKNHGRIRGGNNNGDPFSCTVAEPDAGIHIATSYYSFTYKQTTGSLLSTRLLAMQHSLQTLDPRSISEDVISGLLKSLDSYSDTSPNRISIPYNGHLPQNDAEMLQFLTVPYLDLSSSHNSYLSPNNENYNLGSSGSGGSVSGNNSVGGVDELPPLRQPSYHDNYKTPMRPPSILRRASSMVLVNQNELFMPGGSSGKHRSSSGSSHSSSNRSGHGDGRNCDSGDGCIDGGDTPPPLPEFWQHQEGIATPLQPGAKRHPTGQAVFATSAKHPYYIKTLNDIACLVTKMSFQEAQSRSILDLVAPKVVPWLNSKLCSPEVLDSRGKLGGELVEIQGRLMSIWIEQLDTGVLMWIAEEVPCYEVHDLAPPAELPRGIERIKTEDDENIVVGGESACWAPLAIGAAVVLDAHSFNITGYNEAALRVMTGLEENLKGRNFSYFVPRFDSFVPCIKHYLSQPGIVVPEHLFRHLAGVPYDSPDFTSPHPTRKPEWSIVAVAHTTDQETGEPRVVRTCVDIQVRVQNSKTIVIWIGYSHNDAPSLTTPLPKLTYPNSDTHLDSPITPVHTPKEVLTPSPPPCEGKEAYSELLNIRIGERRRTLKFDMFEELKLLGRGAYGEVRLVRTPSKQHVVVLKSIFKDRILVDTWSRDRDLGTIPNEIKILNQLRASPQAHIVQMIDFFEDTKCYHLEMLPFGESPSLDLFDYIEMKSDSVSPASLLQIWVQIATAVAHIHSLGIIHRDLKDENVIMDNKGNAKLIDFGSAAYVKQGPFDVFVGTIDYAAPEIVQGELYAGPPQDAWALGVLLYIIMFKEPPFNGADEIAEAKIADDFTCIGDTVIRKLLVKKPEARPTVAQCLVHLAKISLKLFPDVHYDIDLSQSD